MLVVGHHTSGKLALTQAESGQAAFLNGLLDIGWIGVDFFFVLSGFIIAMTLSQGPAAGQFVYRRFIRVYLPFWVVFGLTLLVSAALPPLRHSLSGFAPWEWVLALGLLPSGHSAPVIGVAWTLHHEILFYAFGALWLIWPRTTLACAAALLLTSLAVHDTRYPIQFLLSPLHWEFVFGIAIFLTHQHFKRPLALAAVACGLVWIFVTHALYPADNDATGAARVLQFGIGFSLICLGSSAWERHGQPGTQAWLQTLKRWGKHLGDWSFGLYLIHIPIILAVLKISARWQNSGNPHAAQYIGLAAMATCVFCAWLFYTRVEQPILKRLR